MVGRRQPVRRWHGEGGAGETFLAGPQGGQILEWQKLTSAQEDSSFSWQPTSPGGPQESRNLQAQETWGVATVLPTRRVFWANCLNPGPPFLILIHQTHLYFSGEVKRCLDMAIPVKGGCCHSASSAELPIVSTVYTINGRDTIFFM